MNDITETEVQCLTWWLMHINIRYARTAYYICAK